MRLSITKALQKSMHALLAAEDALHLELRRSLNQWNQLVEFGAGRLHCQRGAQGMKQLLAFAPGCVLQSAGHGTKIVERQFLPALQFRGEPANQFDRTRIIERISDLRRVVERECEHVLQCRRKLSRGIDA